jgi:hypothetical protein
MEKIPFPDAGPYVTNLANVATIKLSLTPGVVHLLVKVPTDKDPAAIATVYIPMTGTVANELLASLREHSTKGNLATPPILGGSGSVQ